MVKLNIGCWKRNFPGFINIDVLDYPHVHFRQSADELPMFDNGSVDLAYASHVLEYFTLDEAKKALTEWHRVLKPGGELRLAVPDFAALIEVYKRFGDIRMLRGSIFAIVDKVLYTKEGVPVFHKMIWDFKLLEETLEEIGFTNIRRYDWKEFLPEGVIDRSASYIPKNDFEHGVLVSLNVMATKANSIGAAAMKTKYALNGLVKKVIRKVERLAKGEFSRPKELYKI